MKLKDDHQLFARRMACYSEFESGKIGLMECAVVLLEIEFVRCVSFLDHMMCVMFLPRTEPVVPTKRKSEAPCSYRPGRRQIVGRYTGEQKLPGK